MPNKILVTYASRTGSTAGVAEVIRKTLAENGAQVDVVPMQEVTDLTPYKAVVAGSAIRAGQWLPEAMEFIQKHRTELNQKPFAAFLVCVTMTMKRADAREMVSGWLGPVRALVKPVSEGYFAGILDISKVPSLADRLKFHISVALGVWSEGDHRDWEAIHDWASELPVKLQP